MLRWIAERFQKQGLVGADWQAQMKRRGKLIERYRQYHRGQHRQSLTRAMRTLLQVKNPDQERFTVNYCDMVVGTIADRLEVDRIEGRVGKSGSAGSGDTLNAWLDAVLQLARFDALQIEVQTAALRDGESWVMVQFNEKAQLPLLAHEATWDGHTGILAVFDSRSHRIDAAAKVWRELDDTRINLYYRDRIERFRASGAAIDGDAQPLGEPEKTDRGGTLAGVPLIRFTAHGAGPGDMPRGELANIIPLQDSLNKAIVSMVASSLLTGFPVFFARGMEKPKALTPGTIISANITDRAGKVKIPDTESQARSRAALLAQMDLRRIEPGEIGPLLKQAEFLISQISIISSTPVPSHMGGDSQSGEALKQRDVRLRGKIGRSQVNIGNCWEDTLALALHQTRLYGRQALGEDIRFHTRWTSAELRDDAEIREQAKLMHEWGFTREALRLMSRGSGANYNEDDIRKLIDEQREDALASLGSLSIPGFDRPLLPQEVPTPSP